MFYTCCVVQLINIWIFGKLGFQNWGFAKFLIFLVNFQNWDKIELL